MKTIKFRRILYSIPALLMLFAMLVFASCNQGPSGPGDGGEGGGNPDTTDTGGGGNQDGGSLPGPGEHDFYSSGETIYVSTSGSDASGDGSESSPYATPQKAADEASRGATIKIKAGTYNGEDEANLAITKSNLHFVGVNGRPHMKLQSSDKPTAYKGIWVIAADSTTIKNIEFSGANISGGKGGNAAGVRIDAGVYGVNIQNVYSHDNQMGILSDVPEGSHVTVEHSEFAKNGIGNGKTHNVYFSGRGILTFRYNYSHDCKSGNIVKSRMAINYISYNVIADGSDSQYMGNYNIDLANGGVAYVIGNVVQQADYTDDTKVNYILLSYGAEGSRYSKNALYLINNTFANEFTDGFLVALKKKSDFSNVEAVIRNNILSGGGTVLYNEGDAYDVTKDHNFEGNPGFADAANLDYHLTSSSTDAIDAGTDPGQSTYGYDLTPMMEYVQTTQSQQRSVSGEIDLGAFEL